MKKVVLIAAVATLAVAPAFADSWEHVVDLDIPIAQTLQGEGPVMNLCADPPEVLEFSGNTHIKSRWRSPFEKAA